MRERYKTALLSNLTSEMMLDVEKKYSISRYFDYLLFSNEIGHMKPEPESFAAALTKLGCEPSEVLFIDDSIRNIEAAEKLGMQTLHALSPEQWQEELVRWAGAGA